MNKDFRIVFTKHAILKLRQRGIRRDWVQKTVTEPENITLENEKYCAFKKFGTIYLKVVFKRLGGLVIIITQHFVKLKK